jgi:hypothetical protein
MLMSARPSKPDAEQQRPGAGVKTSIVSGQLSALHADRTNRISACGTNNARRPEIDIICGKYCARIGDRDLNVEGRGRCGAIVEASKRLSTSLNKRSEGSDASIWNSSVASMQ